MLKSQLKKEHLTYLQLSLESPLPNITGTVKRDVTFIYSEITGGKTAISDHRVFTQ